MIAMNLGPLLRWIVVGAPGYLRQHGIPKMPEDIREHSCIRMRCHEAIYKWEFEKDGDARIVDAPGPLIVNDLDLAAHAAEDGVGLAYCIESQVAEQLETGRLQAVLGDWCVPTPGFQLYYPNRRQPAAGLRALAAMIRARQARSNGEESSMAA
jgi:DNA-binding transcriptional LysR family regulator